MAGINAPKPNPALREPDRFYQARRRADAERRWARLTGRSAELICFDQVQSLLGSDAAVRKGRREIPLNAIVGSVGRCSEFTRSFRPLHDRAYQRWTAIWSQVSNARPLPPIEVLQIGDAYFVIDGHHRVSAAREQGMTAIEAQVVVFDTKVSLSPEVQPEELALQAEYTSFLESTQLDRVRPNADLQVTILGEASALQAEIASMHQSIQANERADAAMADAAAQWHDTVYLPAVDVVRRQHLLSEFKGRTEADLVLSLRKHLADLEEALGWEIGLELAATDLLRQHRTAHRSLAAVVRTLPDTWTPAGLKAGPAPGAWRQRQRLIGRSSCLFGRILVPLSGAGEDEMAVAQAVQIACRTSAQLLGLHVIPSRADRDPMRLEAVQQGFHDRRLTLGMEGTIAVDEGRIAGRICQRSQWADLVVVRPDHAPPRGLVAKLRCGLRTLIRGCSTPVLVVPGASSALERPLLAYDGSDRSREALFLATYLAERGNTALAVVTVAQGKLEHSQLLSEATAYLQSRGIEATLLEGKGTAAEAILEAAATHGSDLIVMGGYGRSPLVELLSGSVVDQVLRASRQPVLLAR
jgi:nucleotide-binding universal stress UspA family protein